VRTTKSKSKKWLWWRSPRIYSILSSRYYNTSRLGCHSIEWRFAAHANSCHYFLFGWEIVMEFDDYVSQVMEVCQSVRQGQAGRSVSQAGQSGSQVSQPRYAVIFRPGTTFWSAQYMWSKSTSFGSVLGRFHHICIEHSVLLGPGSSSLFSSNIYWI
jgi:hypothetical protein